MGVCSRKHCLRHFFRSACFVDVLVGNRYDGFKYVAIIGFSLERRFLGTEMYQATSQEAVASGFGFEIWVYIRNLHRLLGINTYFMSGNSAIHLATFTL